MSKRAEEYANKQFPYKIKKVGWLQQNEDVNATFRLIAQEAYEQAEKDTIEKAKKWLIEHINIDCDVQQSEDGQPLASDYIKHAKKRFEVANQIASEFSKAILEE